MRWVRPKGALEQLNFRANENILRPFPKSEREWERERERDIRRFQNEGQREKRDITSLGALKRQAMRYYIWQVEYLKWEISLKKKAEMKSTTNGQEEEAEEAVDGRVRVDILRNIINKSAKHKHK